MEGEDITELECLAVSAITHLNVLIILFHLELVGFYTISIN